MSLLQSPNLQILPYDPSYWQVIAKYFYNKKYQYFFRHYTKAFTQAEFERFEQVTGSQVYVICNRKNSTPIGILQYSPDWKTNRAFYIGLIIDEAYQNKRYPLEAFMCFFDYAFNRLGMRKAIVEIIESHESLKKIVVENGFLYEGKLYNECFFDGQYVTELRYCMMDSFYNKKYKPEVDKWQV